jgi:AcrR family transcriptional regulator
MRRTATETRELVLRVAHELFYWNGIRATGIDRIVSESRVTVTTVYRLFGSKDDLVGAYMERAHGLYREWFDAAAAAGGDHPRDRILAVFDALTEQVQPQNCRGCPFLMALAEFPDPDLPVHRHAVAMKTWVRSRLGELTAELAQAVPVEDADRLADHLSLIFEGVYASVQALGVDGPAHSARAFAASLLPGG